MPENAKILTNVSSFQDVQKSLQEVEKKLNELSKSVNSEAETEVSDKDGKTGDIKTTRNEDGTYTFEIKTKEGWKTPALGASLIKFKDKLSSLRQITTKSIDEIEVNDSSTGDSTANLTTFDEKNNKFILPRSDYDSGWIDIDRTDSNKKAHTLTHNLGTSDILNISVLVKDSYGEQDGTAATNAIMEYINFKDYDSISWIGMRWELSDTQVQIISDNNHHLHHAYDDTNLHRYWDRIDVRIRIWK
tara:strand:- start:13155 stop:13892 length:738 start_codon:yes stop_codon:yes gene_type:complete